MTTFTYTQSVPVTVDPEVMSGVPVFRGTRVPVQTLFDYILDGCTLDEFLDNFPTVNRTAADALIRLALLRLTTSDLVLHENSH